MPSSPPVPSAYRPGKNFSSDGATFLWHFLFSRKFGWVDRHLGGGWALRMGRRDDAWNAQVKQWALRARKAPFPELSGRDDVLFFSVRGARADSVGGGFEELLAAPKTTVFCASVGQHARHDCTTQAASLRMAKRPPGEALDCPARDCLARQTATRPAGWMVMAAPRNGWWPRRSEVTPRQRTGDVASGISRKSDKWLCHKTVRHPLPRQVFSHAGNVFLRLGTRSESGVHNQS